MQHGATSDLMTDKSIIKFVAAAKKSPIDSIYVDVKLCVPRLMNQPALLPATLEFYFSQRIVLVSYTQNQYPVLQLTVSN